jgi:hypothetical protein
MGGRLECATSQGGAAQGVAVVQCDCATTPKRGVGVERRSSRAMHHLDSATSSTGYLTLDAIEASVASPVSQGTREGALWALRGVLSVVQGHLSDYGASLDPPK